MSPPPPPEPKPPPSPARGAFHSLRLSLRYLLRNAARRKGRFLLGALGVFVGVALLTAIQVGLDSLSLAYVDFATITAGKSDALVFGREGHFSEPAPFDPGPPRETIEAIEGVAGAVPGIFTGARVSAEKTVRSLARIADPNHPAGVDPASLTVTRSTSSGREGGPPAPGLADGACLASEALAEELGLRPGDAVRAALDRDPPETASLRVRSIVRPDGDPEASFLVLPQSALDPDDAADGPPAVAVTRTRSGFTALVSVDVPAFRRLDMGTFRTVEQDGDDTGPPYDRAVPPGSCLVSAAMAERFGLEPGDALELAGFRPPFGLGAAKRLAVEAVVEQRGMFPDALLHGYCVLSPADAADAAGHPGLVSFLAVSFENRREIYDARDLHRSVLRARAVGESIQKALGLDYRVQMPKSTVLDLRESVTSLLRGIFTLFGAVALAISAILIYSLLSISVEERVRENAILRTLGAKKGFVVSLVLGEGLLLCAAGSVGGVFAGVGLTWLATLVGSALAQSEGFPIDIPLFVKSSSVALPLAAGLVVSVVSAVLPARKSVRTSIIEALNAYRSLPSPWKIIRERGLDTRLVGAGLVITLFMGFFTLLIPRMLASGDPTLVAVILGLVLLTLLTGMVLLSLGAQTLLERLVHRILRPVLGRAASLAERNLRRYRRRNTATSLIFSLSVALVLFAASMASLFFRQAVTLARHMNGADIRVETYRKPRIDFEKELRGVEGVAAMAKVYVGRMARSNDSPDWRIRVYLSDLGGIRRARVRLYGGGPAILDAAFAEDIRYAEGGPEAFQDLTGDPGEAGTGRVILPRSVASRLSVGKGNLVRLQCRAGGRRSYRILEVAAVTDKMPGFRTFYSGAGRANGAGILVPHQTFLALLEGEEAGTAPEAGQDKEDITWRTVFLLQKKKNAGDVGKRIRDRFGWARMGTSIRDTDDDMRSARRLYFSTQILFTAILLLSVTIALFGLLASMYTTVLERKREVVILKALGMRKADLFRMFAGETTALLLTSGILGAVTGFVLAYLLVSQQTVISELPTPFSAPLLPMAGMIAISILMGIFGAWLPTRSLLKKSPAEIIRES